MGQDGGNCGMWRPAEEVLDELTCGCGKGYMTREGTFVTGDDIRAGLALPRDQYEAHRGCKRCAESPLRCPKRRTMLLQQPQKEAVYLPIAKNFQMFVRGKGIVQYVLEKFLSRNNPATADDRAEAWICMTGKTFEGRDGFWVCSQFRISTADIIQLKILTFVYLRRGDIRDMLGRPSPRSTQPFTEMTRYLTGTEEEDVSEDDIRKLIPIYASATTELERTSQLERNQQRYDTARSHGTGNAQADALRRSDRSLQPDPSSLASRTKNRDEPRADNNVDAATNTKSDRRHQDIPSRGKDPQQSRHSSSNATVDRQTATISDTSAERRRYLDLMREGNDDTDAGRHAADTVSERPQRHGPRSSGELSPQAVTGKEASGPRRGGRSSSYGNDKVVVHPAATTRRATMTDKQGEDRHAATARSGQATRDAQFEDNGDNRPRESGETDDARHRPGRTPAEKPDSGQADTRPKYYKTTDSRGPGSRSTDTRSTESTPTESRKPSSRSTRDQGAQSDRITFFIPEERVDLKPLDLYIQVAVDSSATIKVGKYQSRSGYLITAKRAINKEEMADIISDTKDFREEQQRLGKMPYGESRTAHRRRRDHADKRSR